MDRKHLAKLRKVGWVRGRICDNCAISRKDAKERRKPVEKRNSIRSTVVFLIFTSIIEKNVDYIIIGQGLAGSSLAMRLIERGQRVMVFDEPLKNLSSRVAAGLFNPITGMGIVKTWLAEELFSSLTDFYTGCEVLFKQKFFYPQLLYRPFYSAEEQNNWMAKSGENSVNRFIERIFTTSAFGDQVQDEFGGILLKACGYLDAPCFLDAVRGFLIAQDSFEETHLSTNEIIQTSEGVRYRDIRGKKIIFCSGVSSYSFFDWLPIRPLKGETLTIRLTERPNVIYNRGIYVVPFEGTGLYKAGATYELKDLARTVTPKGKMELEEKLMGLLKKPFEIVGQEWGIRPTTVDRRPMLGNHPEMKNLIIFNGLGTKGVSLAPYFSGHLANWLMGQGELLREVNITRFKALYSKS
ncbi:MAG: NAD(P)/FAD-dependent oxidoreductase [Cyclobacteriaceae bacterium]